MPENLGDVLNESAGWWLTYPSEKYEFISWDDYPIYEMENNPAMFETTNQVVF
jgi:hypothetical protein